MLMLLQYSGIADRRSQGWAGVNGDGERLGLRDTYGPRGGALRTESREATEAAVVLWFLDPTTLASGNS